MRCSSCEERQVEYSNKIAQFEKEIAFLEERHQLTAARKSDLMQDWLADQAVKNALRCQLQRGGLVPVA